MIKNFFKTNNIEYLEEVSLKKYNTYHIDTLCAYLAFPKNKEELIIILKELTKENIKHFILGNGSNIILSMDYYDGVIIKLDRMNKITYQDNIIVAEAGCSLIKLALDTIDKSLSGLTFAAGIPGLVGASTAMNAGAYNSDMSKVVKEVELLDENYQVITLKNSQLEYSYRDSLIKRNKNLIVLSTTFELSPGDSEEMKKQVEERKQKRFASQPLNLPSAGSTFKRGEDFITAQLIDECGLKGYTVGGAQVSEKHAGFVVNIGNATAKDVIELTEYVKKKVYEKFNKKIELEIEIV